MSYEVPGGNDGFYKAIALIVFGLGICVVGGLWANNWDPKCLVTHCVRVK